MNNNNNKKSKMMGFCCVFVTTEVDAKHASLFVVLQKKTK